MLWNGHDPRAVVATAELTASRDVVSPSHAQADASPSSFGLGIYSCAEDDSVEKKPLPMFYVSPAVACDRSPLRNPKNPRGVVAGWYVVAQPSTHFEIHITRVNQRKLGTKRNDRLSTQLYVDGQFAYSTSWSDKFLEHEEHTMTGFVEKAVQNQSGDMTGWVRKFAFEKATTTVEEDGDPAQSEAGSIRLHVEAGRQVLRKNNRQEWRYSIKKLDISEKAVAKLGKSLTVRCDGNVEKHTWSLGKYKTVVHQSLPAATLTIFVREAWWMRSRRLIGDAGMPCTFDMYSRLLKGDSAAVKEKRGRAKPEIQIAGRAAKRNKHELVEVVDVDLVNHLEVIDLT